MSKVKEYTPTLKDLQISLKDVEERLASIKPDAEKRLRIAADDHNTKKVSASASRAKGLKPHDEAKKRSVSAAKSAFESVKKSVELEYQDAVSKLAESRNLQVSDAKDTMEEAVEEAREKFNVKAGNLFNEHKIEQGKLENYYLKEVDKIHKWAHTQDKELVVEVTAVKLLVEREQKRLVDDGRGPMADSPKKKAKKTSRVSA